MNLALYRSVGVQRFLIATIIRPSNIFYFPSIDFDLHLSVD